jgi:hypothetical protein
MTPVAFALFIIALVWPLQRRLKAVLPQVIAVLVTASVALLAIGSGGWLVVWGFGGFAHWVIANAARLQGLYMHAADLLEQRGLYAAELFAEQINVSWLVQVLRAIGGSLQDVLSFCIVTFVFVILGLLEVEPLGRRLRRIGSGGATDTAAEIAARLQTYMLVRFGMSALTGLSFWAFTAVYGLELHREWGVIAFVLNFIPFIGSFLATLLPTLFAAAQFESIRRVRRVHQPQRSSVRHRQLHRTTRCWDGGFGLPLHDAVCGILLGHALGHSWRLYRCADPDRARDRLRPASAVPPDRCPAFGRRNDASEDGNLLGSIYPRDPDEPRRLRLGYRSPGLEISQNCKARGRCRKVLEGVPA